MGTKFKFYFRQGIASTRRSTMVIMGLVLAISIIAGLNFFLDSYQTQKLAENYDNVIDTRISEHPNPEDTPYLADLNAVQLAQESIIQQFNREEFYHEEWYKYFQTYFTYPAFSNTSDFSYFVSESNFYQSPRFTEYFMIYEGRSPQTENEIMVEYSYAKAYDINIGDNWCANFSSDRYLNDSDIYDEFEDLTGTITAEMTLEVAGVYVAKTSIINVASYYYRFPTIYNSATEKIEVYEKFNNYYYDSNVIFSMSNFTEGNMHPILETWNTLIEQKLNVTTESRRLVGFNTGIFGIYDRESISYRNVISTASKLSNMEKNILDLYIDASEFGYTNYIGRFLKNYAEEITILRIATQFMNIPIFGFGVFIGIFNFQISTKEKADEFLLLRSKGIPQRMIKHQFLVEATIIGTISSTIAIGIGRVTYEIFKSFMPALLGGNLESPLSFQLTFLSILIVYISGIFMTIISSLPSIRSINKLESSDLLGKLGSDDLDVEYDETTLFTTNPKSAITLSDTPFLINDTTTKINYEHLGDNSNAGMKTLPNTQNNNQQNNGNKKRKLKRKSKDAHINLYRNSLKGKEKKIRKIGWILLVISLFPLFYFILYLISISPNAPDTLFNLTENLLKYLDFMIVFAILAPLFMVIGINRLIMKEKPSRFAHIIKKIARLFVKQKDYIVALQMIKEKEFRRFVNLVAIFTSLFLFSNLFFVSVNGMEIINQNYEVGADAKIYLESGQNPEILGNITILEINAAEKEFKNITTSNNKTFIDEAALLVERTVYSDYHKEFFVNISKYIEMIQEDGKYMPSRDYQQKLEEIQKYLDDPNPEKLPGIIVTPRYLEYNNLEVGDTSQVSNRFFNETSNSTEEVSIDVKIISELPFFVGLYNVYSGRYSWNLGIIMDTSLIEELQISNAIDEGSFRSYMMLDLTDKYAKTKDDMRNMLLNSSLTNLEYRNFYLYISDATDIDAIPQGDSIIFTVYRVIYMEFIIIGALIAITLAIFMLGMLRKNKYLNGLLLSRGIGWRGLNKFLLAELSIVFVLALGIGLASGILSTISLLKIYQNVIYGGRNFPILAKPLDILYLFGTIVGLSFAIYSIAFHYESKKNITEYFHKF